MAYEISRTEVWSGELADQPGALAGKLEALERAGANLDFVIVRPLASPSGGAMAAGVLFVAPLVGSEQQRAAEEAGLRRSVGMHVLRLIGPDRPGLGAAIARHLASAGLNIAGLSAAAIDERCIFYLRFASEEDVRRAAQVLTGALGA